MRVKGLRCLCKQACGQVVYLVSECRDVEVLRLRAVGILSRGFGLWGFGSQGVESWALHGFEGTFIYFRCTTIRGSLDMLEPLQVLVIYDQPPGSLLGQFGPPKIGHRNL